MKYIVVELQTDGSGNVANIVTKHDTRNEADSKFHTVLAAAAVSAVPVHAAAILTNEGKLLDRRCYMHGTAETSGDEEMIE